MSGIAAFGAMNIGISSDMHSFGSNHSWNRMYTAKVVEGALKLSATMSMMNNREDMSIEEVVKDIWMNYVQQSLER